MGKGKVHSGAGEFKEIRTDDKFVCNREVIALPRLCTTAILLQGKAAAVATGISIVSPDETITTPVYTFNNDADAAVQFHTTVPSGLPAGAQLVIRPYWTALSGVVARGVASGVVWDVDYMITPVSYFSGTINQPRTRFLTGTVSNATAGINFFRWQSEISGGYVCDSKIIIPSSKILPDAFVNCLLFRDAGETGDDLEDAHLLCVVLEYTKA